MTIFFKRAILALFFLGVVPIQATGKKTIDMQLSIVQTKSSNSIWFTLYLGCQKIGYAQVFLKAPQKECCLGLLEIDFEHRNKGSIL